MPGTPNVLIDFENSLDKVKELKKTKKKTQRIYYEIFSLGHFVLFLTRFN